MGETMAVMHEIYLKPAEMVLCKKPCKVTTVLGSCLAVILYHQKSRTGAICHALLPVCPHPSRSCREGCRQTFRYVDCSLRFMLDRYGALGAQPSELTVKLFGGADMFIAKSQESISDVGRQNVEMATRLVEEQGLNLTAASLGGIQGRKLFFFTHTGLVEMKYVQERDPVRAGSLFLEERLLLSPEAR
jgi:chemotaxis protein CheD